MAACVRTGVRSFAAHRVLWLIVALLVSGAPSADAQDTRAFLDVRVNGQSAGDALVVLRGDDVLIRTDTLVNAGLVKLGGHRETLEAEEFVSLTSLAPALRFSLDERALQLTITAAAAMFGRAAIDMQPGAPPNMEYRRDTSALLNYAVSYRDGALDLFAEPAVNVKGASLQTTIAAGPSGTVRGLTALTVDRRASIQRWTVGDAFASTGVLGGGAFVSGLRVAKDFGVSPYYVRYPTLTLSGAVTAPSIAEVYVNGRLVAREALQPGQFDLRNVPITIGPNAARVVVRDPFGGTRELTANHYRSTAILKRGVQDYEYAAGFQREAVATESWQYGPPALLARHRIGLSDTVTAGARLEASSGLVSGGPAIQVRLPFGDVEGGGGFSRQNGRTGGAFNASYFSAGPLVSGGASIVAYSESYATVGGVSPADAPKRDVSLFASTQLGRRGSLSVEQTHRAAYSQPSQWRTSVVTSMRVSRAGDLSLTMTRVRDASGGRFEWFGGLSVQLGGQTLGSLAVERRDGADSLSLDVQRSLPVGLGYGYHLRAEGSAGSSRLSGDGLYQTSYGRYEVRRDVQNGRSADSFSASGALVAIGGGVYASRPVENSFALVRVPGVAGVQAFSSHQPVGRTDRHGDLLVPDLLPYYGNELSISDQDVPLDYELRRVHATIAPPYRGGALIVFPIQQVRAAAGRLTVRDGSIVRTPAYGNLTVQLDSGPVASPIGAAGEFYLDGLPPGRHRTVVDDAHGTCTFTLVVPVAAAGVVDLGDLQCLVK